MSRSYVLLLGALALALILSFSLPREASAQVCAGASGAGDECQAIIDDVVDDIFMTSDGRYAPQLTFATHIRGAQGCRGWTGWDGVGTHDPNRRTFLDRYLCWSVGDPATPPGVTVEACGNHLDWWWNQQIRSGAYDPTMGRVMDLGGEANRVVIFPITDHGPLPCESFEYTVWLSNNPDATEVAADGAPDPNKWNPARLMRLFTQGWTRNVFAEGEADRDRPDLGTFLRDNSAGEAIADSLITVWALPCGLTFRYVSVQAGNNGNPGPVCAFDSTDDELDAVAGLNEDDTAICVDADGDGHRDAACGGSDCDDTNPDIHPGAFEPCNSAVDLDCQPPIECPMGTRCEPVTGLCSTICFEGACASGYTCVDGQFCLEEACAMRTEPCPAGTLCRGGACVAPCDGAVCPAGQVCRSGACIDPCEGVVCPSNQVCIARDPSALTLCGPACTCTELAVPLCDTEHACDERPESPTFGECVAPGCESITCGEFEICVEGACVDACEGVVCPRDQICLDGECVTDRCASIMCPGSQVCRDGVCYDACDGVSCGEGELCRDGACVPDPCFGVSCPTGQLCRGGGCVPDPSFDAGTSPDGGTGPGFDAGPGGPGGGDDGCGCRAVGNGDPSGDRGGGLLLGFLALLGLLWRRRR